MDGWLNMAVLAFADPRHPVLLRRNWNGCSSSGNFDNFYMGLLITDQVAFIRDVIGRFAMLCNFHVRTS